MADKSNPSDPAGPRPRSPRRPRTIDVEATDVSTSASSASASATTSDASSPEPSPSQGTAWVPGGGIRPMLTAAAVGAIGMLIVLVLLWNAGLVGGSANGVSSRLTAIEGQLRDLTTRPNAARNGGDSKALEELATRIERLEKSAFTPQSPLNDPALSNRLASAENATKAFADDIGSLNRRVDDLAAAVRELRMRVDAATPIDKSEFDAMGNRIAALEKSAGLMESEIGKRATVTSDRAVRLALATSALRAQVERGEPFVAELAAARPLAPENAFAALEPFAASGVPSNAALARELASLVPALRNAASTTPPGAGFFERLKSNAGRLVRIRPTEDSASDDPIAVIGRIETEAARLDVAGALDDLAKLPEPVRAPAQSWIEKAQARVKAIATSRQLAADAIGALGRATP